MGVEEERSELSLTVMMLLRIATVSGAAAFPISELRVTPAQLQELTAGSEDFAVDLMLPSLMQFFEVAENRIAVEPGDIVVQQDIPNTVVDTHCEHHIEAKGSHARGTIMETSYLKGGVNLSWQSAKVFMDAELDASLDINGDVQVKTGVKLFHHCDKIASDTMHLDLTSTGKNGVGMSMTASNAHVQVVDGDMYLVFNFHADVWGTVVSWNVDEISVHKGCKVKVLGITLVSVCGYISKKVGEQAQKLLNQVNQVYAPNLIKKLEDKINTAIGSEVRIPLQAMSAVVA